MRYFLGFLCMLRARPLQHPPLLLAKYLSDKIEMSTYGCRCLWTEVDDTMSSFIVRKYFGAEPKSLSCQVFLIEGIPAACLLYNKVPSREPDIEEIHINESMILRFDAGPAMRNLLYRKHKNINMSHAVNRNVFFTI